MIYKGYKIRLFPSSSQEKALWEHIHGCRFVWNYMLKLQQDNYQNGFKHMTEFDMSNKLTDLRKMTNYLWLNNVCRGSLEIICRDLSKAFNSFFEKQMHYPCYKTKKSKKFSYPLRANRTYFINKNMVKIPSIGKIKCRNIKISNSKLIDPRISYIGNKWILSFSIECENQTSILTDKTMGIDLGIKELAVVAIGNEKIIFHNINKSKRIKKLNSKLKHINRIIQRKYKTNGSYNKTNNIIKYEDIVRNIYRKIANINNNYINQITHKLVNLCPCRVIMENLDIRGMCQNKFLSAMIYQQRLYEFIRQMKYKCEWNGIEFVQADKYYPSSKTCSCCGNIKKDLKLSDRTYNCSKCGLKIDRDYNAAINLMKYVSHDGRLTA